MTEMAFFWQLSIQILHLVHLSMSITGTFFILPPRFKCQQRVAGYPTTLIIIKKYTEYVTIFFISRSCMYAGSEIFYSNASTTGLPFLSRLSKQSASTDPLNLSSEARSRLKSLFSRNSVRSSSCADRPGGKFSSMESRITAVIRLNSFFAAVCMQ